MHTYELTYILNPNLADDEATALTERITGFITNHGGELGEIKEMGRRRLAYPIERHLEGVYTVTRFRQAPEALIELDHSLRVLEPVLRHLVIRLDE